MSSCTIGSPSRYRGRGRSTTAAQTGDADAKTQNGIAQTRSCKWAQHRDRLIRLIDSISSGPTDGAIAIAPLLGCMT